MRREVRAQTARSFWFFRRMEAVVLTMLERWPDLADVLPSLERVAARGGSYLEALLGGIREEWDAAHGGPNPTHARLRALGYLGWSRLLAFRPSVS